MTLGVTTTWLARGGAVAAAVAALELLWVHRALADTGVFGWPVLRRDLVMAPRWLRAVADCVFSYRGIMAVLVIQLASALALPWLSHPALPWLVVASTLLISIRFRGTYNGGSDAMLLIVMVALGLARGAPGSRAAEAGLAYAAVQLVLSYFVAGIAKLPDPAWRSGRAVTDLVRLPHYRAPAWAIAALSRASVARTAAWSMLAFECSFPLAFVHPSVCTGLMICGVGFHLVTAIVLGLNRFLWTWLTAYPALLYWVDRVNA